MTLKVIGTGFGRTGTDSMREALNILGFGPCHHMHELMNNETQKQLWYDHATGKNPGWDKLFNGYNSCVDWPSASYWRDLIVEYPDAKVILTWRSAESWWTSFEKTILPHMQDPEKSDTVGNHTVARNSFGGQPITREHAINTYNANTQAVKTIVAPERLLVYKIGDGWGPLCKHLGVAVPDSPYPNRNTTKEFNADRVAEAIEQSSPSSD